MPYISESTIEKIKQKLTIVDVVSGYVKLKKSGRNYVGLCPFHIEKTPSFFVNEDKGIYHCFGCGEGGNIFKFIMKIENVSFPESIEILAKKAEVTIEYKEGPTTDDRSEKELIYKINKRVIFIYQYYLKEMDDGKIAREILKHRGVSDNMINKFNLGYAPAGNDNLYKILKKEKYNEPIMLKSGLIIASQRGGYYDRFRNRIMFPIIDVNDNVIGFGGRIIDDNPNLAKYMNTPETIVFSKRNNLFGLNVARNKIREKRQAIVVEGYFDVITLFAAGIENVVAPLGTALTEEQVLLLKRYADEIILLFDSDIAGNNATLRSISLLLKTNLTIKVLILPTGYDPDQFVRERGGEALLKMIKEAPKFLNFIIKDALKKFDSKTSKGKSDILNSIFPVLKMIPDEVLKDDVLQYLGEKLVISDEVVRRKFSEFTKEGTINYKDFAKYENKISALTYAERGLALIILENPGYAETVFNNIMLDDIEDDIAKTLLKILYNFYREHNKILADEILGLIENEQIQNYITKEIISSKYKDNIDKQLSDYIYIIKSSKIENEIKQHKKNIKSTKDFEFIKKEEEILQSLYKKRDDLLKARDKM